MQRTFAILSEEMPVGKFVNFLVFGTYLLFKVSNIELLKGISYLIVWNI